MIDVLQHHYAEDFLDRIWWLTMEALLEADECDNCKCCAASNLDELVEYLQRHSDAVLPIFHQIKVERETLARELSEARREAANLRRRLERRIRNQLISRELRAAVFERDGHQCRYCGIELNVGAATLDHYYPDGAETAANLVTACRPCNLRKGTARPGKQLAQRGMKLIGKKPPREGGPPTLRNPNKPVTRCSPTGAER